jgi:hypothetical protein
MTALGTAAVALISPVDVFAGGGKNVSKNSIRIQPVSNRHYSRSFLKFCERARFNSVEEAIRQVKNRKVEFRLCKTEALV